MSKSRITGFGFSALYLLACFIIWILQFEGSWGGFFCFLLAIPFSFLSIVISNYFGGSFIFFLILNAIWWYFLGWLLYFFVILLCSLVRKLIFYIHG
jgi:hypothetical protein